MGQGISGVLVYAVGVAISPMPIIAVTLMLFSRRARVNGPVFLLGWLVALATVSGVAYVLAHQGGASTSSSTSDALAWGKIAFGVLFLLLAARNSRARPAPGTEPEMPKWMGGVDSLTPAKDPDWSTDERDHRRRAVRPRAAGRGHRVPVRPAVP